MPNWSSSSSSSSSSSCSCLQFQHLRPSQRFDLSVYLAENFQQEKKFNQRRNSDWKFSAWLRKLADACRNTWFFAVQSSLSSTISRIEVGRLRKNCYGSSQSVVSNNAAGTISLTSVAPHGICIRVPWPHHITSGGIYQWPGKKKYNSCGKPKNKSTIWGRAVQAIYGYLWWFWGWLTKGFYHIN